MWNYLSDRRDNLNLEKIRQLCKERGITIADLEKAVKLGNGTIGKWANSYPRADNLKSVADYLGVTTDELLNEDGNNDA